MAVIKESQLKGSYHYKPYSQKFLYIYKNGQQERRVYLDERDASDNLTRLKKIKHYHNLVSRAAKQSPDSVYYIELRHE